ncbi:tyrosine-type recombinase/integrase [Rodentibacter haemolyticus]|uniref:Tyrosine-type recombinase/integrase n=1 Tax=Rodentibacter haemolyticus TaxID=2778911 RepID=A0ABX6UZ32_9PAST|nr:tyrosine-type recombinase/integrase [Rodentibacter haemolyticus]QPB43390.1 tyrosine-type recombinase/integrase [Rodentibacter haemolyticus]
MIKSFQRYLSNQNLANNTISVYLFAIKQFQNLFPEITKSNLKQYKTFLIEHYKPQTANLRIRSINYYLEFIKKERLKLTFVKVQQKTFLENVISEADYRYFKERLKADNNLYWYFVIRFMAATGARVSELIQFKCEHIKLGYIDLYSKGGKLRRIYIPELLQKECLKWLENINRQHGFIFINRYNKRITTRGIAGQLKILAKRYQLDPKLVYPHSFRHRFAKSFLERFNDLAFLADLMGHETIETTRIYLRRTSTEQQAIVNKVIDW